MSSYSVLREYVTELKQLGVSSAERRELIENSFRSELERIIFTMKADAADKHMDRAYSSAAKSVIYSTLALSSFTCLKFASFSDSVVDLALFYGNAAAVVAGSIGYITNIMSTIMSAYRSASTFPKVKSSDS